MDRLERQRDTIMECFIEIDKLKKIVARQNDAIQFLEKECQRLRDPLPVYPIVEWC